MKGMVIIAIVASFIAMLLVMEFYPHLEGIMEVTGSSIASATGYTPNRSEAAAAKSSLWAVFPAIIIVALFMELYRRDSGG